MKKMFVTLFVAVSFLMANAQKSIALKFGNPQLSCEDRTLLMDLMVKNETPSLIKLSALNARFEYDNNTIHSAEITEEKVLGLHALKLQASISTYELVSPMMTFSPDLPSGKWVSLGTIKFKIGNNVDLTKQIQWSTKLSTTASEMLNDGSMQALDVTSKSFDAVNYNKCNVAPDVKEVEMDVVSYETVEIDYQISNNSNDWFTSNSIGQIVDAPKYGTVSILPNNKILYTSTSDKNDKFTHTVCDEAGACATVVTNIKVRKSASTTGSEVVEMSVYPNPCYGNFDINSPVDGEISVQIVDTKGALVYSKNQTAVKGEAINVSMENPVGGNYLVTVRKLNELVGSTQLQVLSK